MKPARDRKLLPCLFELPLRFLHHFFCLFSPAQQTSAFDAVRQILFASFFFLRPPTFPSPAVIPLSPVRVSLNLFLFHERQLLRQSQVPHFLRQQLGLCHLTCRRRQCRGALFGSNRPAQPGKSPTETEKCWFSLSGALQQGAPEIVKRFIYMITFPHGDRR